MNWKTALRLAFAETRRSSGKLIFCVFAIAVGVGALTAVRTTVTSLEASIAQEARTLMGADLQFDSRQPLAESSAARELAAELQSRGADRATLTEFYSMLLVQNRVPRSAGLATDATPADVSGDNAGEGEILEPPGSRLARVRAVSGRYPFYGAINTDPDGRWTELLRGEEPLLIADPTLLRLLDLGEGSIVRLGQLDFRVIAAFRKEPGSPVSGFGYASPVYIHADWLDETGLLGYGSRVRYQWLFRTPDSLDPLAWKQANFAAASEGYVEVQTYREAAASLQRFLDRLGSFLTLTGLITLLLGGLGIGSALAVFIRDKLDHAAILRSMGASPNGVLQIYALLALLLGLAGSVLGVVPGALLPVWLSDVAREELAGLLPIAVSISFSWPAALQGLSLGVVAALLFTIAPLYRVRQVSPLRVLRHNDEDQGRPGWRDLAVYAGGGLAVFGFVLLVTASQTGSLTTGFYFAASIAAAIGALWLVAKGITLGVRRLLPYIRNYHVRQGVANLYRPGNQTGAVIMSTGVGVLLLTTIFILEHSFQQEINVERRAGTPNIFLLDVQPDQRAGLEELLASRESVSEVSLAPMVTARLRSVNGRSVARGEIEEDAVQRSWSDRLRTREYFLSYRAEQLPSETVVAGEFWPPQPERQEASVTSDWAEDMGVELGDRLEFDIQGIPLEAQITSLREVEWQSMRPNTMVLLSPGEIEYAPRIFIGSFRVEVPQGALDAMAASNAGEADAADASADLTEEERRAALNREIARVQEAIVRRYSNISVIDVTQAVDQASLVMEQVSAVIRALAILTLINGIVILAGAVAAARFTRLREAMLLKVLGAGRRDLRTILITEYASLAALGCVAGWALAELINRPLLAYVLRAEPALPYLPVLATIAGVILLNTLIGLFISRDVSRASPLSVLREE